MRRRSRGHDIKRFARSALLLVRRRVGVRQFHADWQWGSRAAHRTACQFDLPFDARRPASVGSQLYGPRRTCRMDPRLHFEPRALGDALRGTPGIVGESIVLNGQPWQVVGIMPPRVIRAVWPGAGIRAARIRGEWLDGRSGEQWRRLHAADRALGSRRVHRARRKRAGGARSAATGRGLRAGLTRKTRRCRASSSRRSSARCGRPSTRFLVPSASCC